jgi:hypothetical protein
MEELTLTDPVVVPEKVTNKYRVASFTMNLEAVLDPTKPTEKGYVSIELRDNHDATSFYQYTGNKATTMIKTLNTANLTTKSMHKRILEHLSKDGFLPGAVTGSPDP